jgi:cytochrome c
MKRNRLSACILAAAAALSVVPAAHAADAPAASQLGSIERAQAKRASALLERAVAYLQKNGPEQAFAKFNESGGPFVQGPYYVFVVGLDGFMHANGGAQLGLVGKNEIELRDAAGKPLIRDLLAQAKASADGTVEYRWLNRVNNHVENKFSQYHKVGKYIVCVGYYTPRGSVEEAQELLDKAVAFMKKSGDKAAFAAFNSAQGGFTHNDLYVFAIGIDDGSYRASGDSPQLAGMDVRGLRDAAGKPMIEEMIKLAQQKGSGVVDFVWRNPATNAVEQKHSLIQRVDQVLLGVGYFSK